MTRDDDLFTEVLLVSPDPGLYSFINQGALTVDGIDDVEEMKMTDVCCIKRGITQSTNLPIDPFFLSAEYFFLHPIPFDEIHYQYTKKKTLRIPRIPGFSFRSSSIFLSRRTLSDVDDPS